VLRDLLACRADRVVEAGDAASAIAVLGQRPRPDLALVDLRMPGGGGLAVLDQVVARPELRGLPVVVVTSAGAGDPLRVRAAERVPVLDKADLTRITLHAAIRAARGEDSG